MKINFLKKKKNFAKESPNLNPSLFWAFILFLAAVTILASFAFGFLLFTEVNQEPVEEPGTSAGSQVEKINKDRIHKILEYFTGREEKSAEVLKTPPTVSDPTK